MCDQAASSLTNVIVAILVMRQVDAEEFGAFAVAMIAYQLVNGLVRALIGEPFLARHSGDPHHIRRGVVGDILGAALVVGVLSALVVLGASLALGGSTGSGLLALAVTVPFLAVHDTLRFEFIIDHPGQALAIDLAWLVLVAAAMVQAPSDAEPVWFVAAWGASGAAAMVLGLVFVRGVSWRLHPIAWLRRTWSDGIRYAGDFATAQATTHIAVLALSAVSLTTLGAVRASQTFYGPLNTVHRGIYLAVVPDGVRLCDRPARLRKMVVLTATGLALLGGIWMLVGVGVPDSVGRQFFDRSWSGADEIMVPMGLSVVAGGIMAGGFLGIRCMGDAHASLRSRVLSAPGQLGLPILGAALGGAFGFALGLAAARMLATGIWWSAFRRSLDRLRRANAADDSSSSLAEPPVPSVARDEWVIPEQSASAPAR